MRTDNFDPLAYIENAFLDTSKSAKEGEGKLKVDGLVERERLEDDQLNVTIPAITDYLNLGEVDDSDPDPDPDPDQPKKRYRKTVMSAPRPRRAKSPAAATEPQIDPDLHDTWTALPKNVAFLCSFYDDSVTKNYYRGEFKESRQELIRRLLDPELSLEETSRLLGVCPATVRRYTNRGWLEHHRTSGGQRRFRLSNIVRFVEAHGRFPQE